MKCSECKAEIKGDTKFCPECGGKVTASPVATISLRCKACGGVLETGSNNKTLTCPYCGEKELVVESDNVAIERIKSNTQKDIEFGKLEFEKEKERRKDEKEEVRKNEEKVQNFKKGFLFKALIVLFLLFVLLTVFCFSTGRILEGMITLVQSAAFAAAWLFGMQIIKEKFPGLHIILTVAGVALTALLIIVMVQPKYTTFVWPDSGIATIVPKPESNLGEISNNSDKRFHAEVEKTTEEAYNNYLKSCKESGFTVEAETGTYDYKAFNEDGYELYLTYYKDDSCMYISVDAPVDAQDIIWPQGENVDGLPKPKSLKGVINSERKDLFSVTIVGMSKEEYRNYVRACEDAGFTIDYDKEDDRFEANDKFERNLTVSYKGNNTVEIELRGEKIKPQTTTSTKKKPETEKPETEKPETEKPEDVTTTAPESDSPASSVDNNIIRPEIKEAIDGYDAFITKYVEFMKKYDANDPMMLKDYLEYLQQYQEMSEKFSKLDSDEELTEAEAEYYLSVLTKTSAKLLEIAVP